MEVNKPVVLIQQHRCAQANTMMTMNVIRYYVYSHYSSDSALTAVDSKHMWQRLKTLMQTPILSAIDLPPQKSRCGHQDISL